MSMCINYRNEKQSTDEKKNGSIQSDERDDGTKFIRCKGK